MQIIINDYQKSQAITQSSACGLNFFVGNFDQVSQKIIKYFKYFKGQIILPCSLHDLALAQKNAAYQQIDICTTDSMWLTWWAGLKHHAKAERVYGPDLMKSILANLKPTQPKTVFLGAEPQVLTKLEKKYWGHFLVLTKDASQQREQEILTKIIKLKPKFIWLGIGSPKQVELAAQLKPKLRNTTIFCVGAAFAFNAGQKKQAPGWIQKSGLEWLFRLMTEPKRLWRRYLVVIPGYIIRSLLNKIKS